MDAVYHRICRAGELPAGTGRLVAIEGRELALFCVDGRLYAIENTCLHAGGPLHEGTLEKGEVICPWHQWRFELATGRCDLNSKVRLEVFAVRERNGWIEIAL